MIVSSLQLCCTLLFLCKEQPKYSCHTGGTCCDPLQQDLHQSVHTCASAEPCCAARREADLITITDKQDLQQAMGEVMEAAERSASLPGHGTRGLPLQTLLTATPLKFQLVKCAEVLSCRFCA